MIIIDACDEIKLKKTFLLATDEPSGGFLDEVDPDMLSEIKETLSSYFDLVDNNPNAYENEYGKQ